MYGPPFARLEKQTTTQIWTSDEQWTRTDNYIILYFILIKHIQKQKNFLTQGVLEFKLKMEN